MAKENPIVLIDDDEDEYELMQTILERQKIENSLVYFSNGHAAYEYLLTTSIKPFLILCDVNMPIMNGFELRKLIWENEYLRQKCIPFIFYTTYASPHSVNEAYKMSVQGFFTKGYDLNNIGKLVNALCTYWDLCEYPTD